MSSSLERHYGRLEARWDVAEDSNNLERLVTAATNASEPIHRWFNLKEAFSPHLLARVLKDDGYSVTSDFRIMDPFCGSGTTLLSALAIAGAASSSLTAVGIERNPFIATLARAKVAGSKRGPELAQAITAELPTVENRYRRHAKGNPHTDSVTLNNERFFTPNARRELLALGLASRAADDEDVRDVLGICAAACVEPAGRLRRDGRALRYVEGRRPRPVWDCWLENLNEILADLRAAAPSPNGDLSVEVGDGRRPGEYWSDPEAPSWIVFSPPYPNNIDYTEVYKLENWVLNLYLDPEHMRSERRLTVQSHPSVVFPDVPKQSRKLEQLVEPILSAVPPDRYSLQRKRMIIGYAADMMKVLENCRAISAPDTRLTYVVGNSLHGHGDEAFVVAADVILARIGELTGWSVNSFKVARHLSRRGSVRPYLRESVVTLRPNATEKRGVR